MPGRGARLPESFPSCAEAPADGAWVIKGASDSRGLMEARQVGALEWALLGNPAPPLQAEGQSWGWVWELSLHGHKGPGQWWEGQRAVDLSGPSESMPRLCLIFSSPM